MGDGLPYPAAFEALHFELNTVAVYLQPSQLHHFTPAVIHL